MSKGVLYFEYDPVENAFYDQCGVRIANMLSNLTPNDLYLFRHDYGNCIFRHRYDRDYLCEIYIEE